MAEPVAAKSRSALGTATALLLIATAPAPPELRLSGMLNQGFEISEFRGCWFVMTASARAEFRRLAAQAGGPPSNYRRRFRIAILGQRAEGRFGHRRSYPCLITATRIFSVVSIPL